MKTSNLGRKLKAWAMSGSLAAALAADDAGQEGRGVLIASPVPQGHGWVNPRRQEVGQGDGHFGPVRTRRDAAGNLQVRQHNGLDLSAPVGTPVQSPVAGIVIRSVPDWRGENANGNEVRVLGEDGREYWFFHLSGRHQPAIGERIDAGASVGEVGRTAIPQGAAAHLHFEVRENGRPVPLESLGDPRQGLFNYILSQPQTTREEAGMIRRYLEQEPKVQQQPAPAAEPSLFDRVMDYIIPSAHGQTRPEGQESAEQLSVNESASARQAQASGSYEYDDSARESDGGQTRRHIPREQSIESDLPVHEGAQWLWEDHREGAAPPASTRSNPYGGPSMSPGDILQLPSQPGSGGPGSPATGGASEPAPLRLEHPEILSPQQMEVPSATPRPAPGMSQDDFRRGVDESMRQFQQADEFNRQNPLQIPDSSRPSGPRYGQQPQYGEPLSSPPSGQYAPQQESWPPRTERNSQGNYSTGDFLEGYTPQPPMSQPQPQRRNRVYWDGGSRPIGSQGDVYQQYRRMQDWSNRQIEQINGRRQERSPEGRYYDYGTTPTPMPTPTLSPTPSVSPGLSPRSSSPAESPPTYSITFDDNAPRSQNRFGYDETPGTANRVSEPARVYEVPELPSGRAAVQARTSGESAGTAALQGP